METERNYVFEDVNNLVDYLFSKFGTLSPLKLQKGLYFLYAYYGATYGSVQPGEGNSEQDIDFPNRLFNAEFEAWTYGPVIREVYRKNKAGDYGEKVIEEDHEIYNIPEVKMFIDEMFGQINSVSDFSLVDRSHEDEAWITAYNTGGQSTTIDNDNLIREYQASYV